jgi:hypothetical protein
VWYAVTREDSQLSADRDPPTGVRDPARASLTGPARGLKNFRHTPEVMTAGDGRVDRRPARLAHVRRLRPGRRLAPAGSADRARRLGLAMASRGKTGTRHGLTRHGWF